MFKSECRELYFGDLVWIVDESDSKTFFQLAPVLEVHLSDGIFRTLRIKTLTGELQRQ